MEVRIQALTPSIVQSEMQSKLTQVFCENYGVEPLHIIKAPGRVNLIGEHTDYNEGYVLPCAIDFYTLAAISPRDDMRVNVLALDWANESDEFSLEQDITFHAEQMWSNYIRGVVDELKKQGYPLRGCNIAITGNVPQGAGLSSSAALEVAVTAALVSVTDGEELSQQDIAHIGQAAENNFVGCACGIMDQLVSSSGIDGHAVLIDCKDNKITPVGLPEEFTVLIVNSNVQRGLVDSEYNLRREQCESVANHFGVPSLRYLNEESLQDEQSGLDTTAMNRAMHVVTENERVLSMVNALAAQEFKVISKLMAESHESMKSLFEITVPAIDALVNIIASVVEDAGGVRMTGGGFGGCVVALVPHALVVDVCEAIDTEYEKATDLKATIYQAKPSAGVSTLF